MRPRTSTSMLTALLTKKQKILDSPQGFIFLMDSSEKFSHMEAFCNIIINFANTAIYDNLIINSFRPHFKALKTFNLI